MSSLEEENSNNEILISSDLNLEKKKLYRTRSCSERSDSGISDCSNHALTTSGSCSCTSTPLLGNRFSINEEPEYNKKIIDESDFQNNNNNSKTAELLEIVGDVKEEKKPIETNETRRCLSDKVMKKESSSIGMCFVFTMGGR